MKNKLGLPYSTKLVFWQKRSPVNTQCKEVVISKVVQRIGYLGQVKFIAVPGCT